MQTRTARAKRDVTIKLGVDVRTLLDTSILVVGRRTFDRFARILERAPKENRRLRQLLAVTPPWE